jgi:sialate O-acetylesterase
MKNKGFYTFLFAALFVFFSGSNLLAKIQLPYFISDNMVLQQKSEVLIWGWTDKKSNVKITTSWNKKVYQATADQAGKWSVKVATPSAGGPFEMTITDGELLTLKNILIGEVWICAGQSNMEMPMKGFRGQPVAGSNDDILKSANSQIRLFTVPRNPQTTPQSNCKQASWYEAKPTSVSEFSATGYYFGRLLHQIMGVPVGLINISYGGSCIEAWLAADKSRQFEKLTIPAPGDSIKVPNRTPTVLFNGMLNPVIGYGIKGCIWYQGETNYQEANIYPQLFSTFVSEIRRMWGVGNFPFYYSQIAPFDYYSLTPGDNNPSYNSAYIREAQLKASDSISNSGMSVLMDIGEKDCIHPKNKKVSGERLAYLSLAKTYGIEGFGYQSPTYKSLEIKDSSIIVSFNNVPNGLTTFGKELTNFEIAGDDKVFYPAKAVMRAKSIAVTSDKVKKPVAVRYAFKDFVTGELFSTEGLPVSSFRTDNW